MVDITAIFAAAAIAAIRSWKDLPNSRQRNLVSAINAAARAASLPLDNFPITPNSLREHMLTQEPAALGVSRGRTTNIRSDLRLVCTRLGIIDQEPKGMTDTWAHTLGGLDARARGGFSLFARWCSAREIEPAAVKSDTLAAFHTHLESRSLYGRPRKLVRALRSAWNRNVGKVEGWPGLRLPHLMDARQYVLPLNAFPESFQRDVASFGVRLSGNTLDEDTFGTVTQDDDAPTPLLNHRPVRPSTVTLRKSHARWAASALVGSGIPVSDIHSLAQLVSDDNPKRILRFLYQRAGGKPSAAGTHVAEVLVMIAKYHACLDQKSVEAIKRLRGPVKLQYGSLTARNERTVRAATEISTERVLLELPGALLRMAETHFSTRPKHAASLALRAVLIEILTSHPLRLDNLRRLEIGRQLHRASPRDRLVSAILIPAEETKNNRAIAMPVPRHTAEMIEVWIRRFRPLLGAAESRFLFPGMTARAEPMTPQALRDAIRNTTARYAGVAISPHQFRHIAARRFLMEYPGHHGEVQALLGHASVDTTKRSYIGMDAEAAHARFDALLADRRRVRTPVAGGRRPGQSAANKRRAG